MTPSAQHVNRKALFLSACRCEPVERVPVWIMRQAGRYLPEYRAVRLKHNFLEVCRTPELAVEVSLQPYRILGVDAVIVFSDILIPAGAMGLPFELTDKGPVIESPLRTAAQIRELAVFDPERETGFLMEAIRMLTRELGPDVPVLGFAAAPWTLACYMIEGHHKDGFPAAKTLLYTDPELFRSLLERIARATARRGSNVADRTYATTLDGKSVRIGFGPHVRARHTVFVSKSRLAVLQKFLDLRKQGQVTSNEIRDRISSRRAQGQVNRANGLQSWRWE